jgi:hypothetical protein
MYEREPDFLEKLGDRLQEFISQRPMYFFGWFALAVGVFMLAASIFHWKWVFSGYSYNMKKIEGISNMFGRGFARVWFGIGGVACIVLGIFLVIIG